MQIIIVSVLLLLAIHTNVFAEPGSVDTNFKFNGSQAYRVYASALQKDGKILIGGEISGVNGTTRHYFARINEDGTLDASFNPPSPDSYVYAIALDSTGRIY